MILWFVTSGYMSLIFYLSSITIEFPGLPENSDKVVHVLIYIPLAVLLYLSLHESGMRKHLLIISACLAALYGISDEVHQYFVPGRSATASDAAADMIGALIGSFGANHWIKRKKNRST